MAKITFTNKTDNQTSGLAEIYKVTAADVNEIKTSTNALYDTLGGFAFYEDTATTTTPINLSQDTWTDLTNNKAGSGTLTSHKPSYITGDLWNSATNTIDLSEVPVGKVLLIRNDYDITTGAANTRMDSRLYFPDTTKSVEFAHDLISTSGDEVRYSRTTQFFVTSAIKTSGVKIQVKVNKNNATARVEDFQITILSF
jgi:hypothetical protein